MSEKIRQHSALERIIRMFNSWTFFISQAEDKRTAYLIATCLYLYKYDYTKNHVQNSEFRCSLFDSWPYAIFKYIAFRCITPLNDHSRTNQINRRLVGAFFLSFFCFVELFAWTLSIIPLRLTAAVAEQTKKDAIDIQLGCEVPQLYHSINAIASGYYRSTTTYNFQYEHLNVVI